MEKIEVCGVECCICEDSLEDAKWKKIEGGTAVAEYLDSDFCPYDCSNCDLILDLRAE